MPPLPLAITMGDPAGIGPEIIVKAAAAAAAPARAGALRLLVIGSNRALEQARAQFAPGTSIPKSPKPTPLGRRSARLQAGPQGEPIHPGVLSADGGRFAFLAVECGVRLASPAGLAPSSPRRSTRRP